MKFFIECTQTYHTRFNSGIQRVVRGIVKSAVTDHHDHVAVPVRYEAGEFVQLDGAIPFPDDTRAVPTTGSAVSAMGLSPKIWIKARLRKLVAGLAAAVPSPAFVRFLYAPRNRFGLARIAFFPFEIVRLVRQGKQTRRYNQISPEAGDVLVLLDSSWDSPYWKTIDAYRRSGVVVAIVVHDLMPLMHPEFCTQGVVQAFTSWITEAIHRADVVIGNSAATALDIQKNLGRFVEMPALLPRISYFWLGSELDGEASAAPLPAAKLLQAAASGLPTYVYVGTIEPRKNHAYALDAFEILWARGLSANFLIVGRVGWHSDAFVERVQSHVQFGKQLLMFNDVDDNGLAYLYSTMQGLVFTSFAEGFGLPVIEGLQRGLPVFASDIPVFREIGASGVRFVDLSNPEFLASALAGHVHEGARRLAAPVLWMTWHDSLQLLQARILECTATRAVATWEIVHQPVPVHALQNADQARAPS